MKIPNTLDLNTYKAYVNQTNCNILSDSSIDAFSLEWDKDTPVRLSTTCIKCIATYWPHKPIFKEIQKIEDQNYLLDILQVQLPLSDLCENINSDVFWRRCFQLRWKEFYPHSTEKRPWISLFLERYLSERLELISPSDWIEEDMIKLLKVCSPYVQRLSICQLQSTMNEYNDHIRLDKVLSNLSELKVLDLSFVLKCIETHFFLGCSNVSQSDIKWLSTGLENCNKLIEFR